jgi:hypothetical protein
MLAALSLIWCPAIHDVGAPLSVHRKHEVSANRQDRTPVYDGRT